MIELDHLISRTTEWYEEQPTWMTRCWSSPKGLIGGAMSLYLSFPAIKITLARLKLRARSRYHPETPNDLSGCMNAVSEVVDFVEALDQMSIQGFWLPYAADHFTMTATVLLKCAVEQRSTVDGTSCLKMCRGMIDKLVMLRDEESLYLGHDCMEPCSAILECIAMDFSGRVDADAELLGYDDIFSLTQFEVGDINDMFSFEALTTINNQ